MLQEFVRDVSFRQNNIVGASVEHTVLDGENMSGESDCEVGEPGFRRLREGELRGGSEWRVRAAPI